MTDAFDSGSDGEPAALGRGAARSNGRAKASAKVDAFDSDSDDDDAVERTPRRSARAGGGRAKKAGSRARKAAAPKGAEVSPTWHEDVAEGLKHAPQWARDAMAAVLSQEPGESPAAARKPAAKKPSALRKPGGGRKTHAGTPRARMLTPEEMRQTLAGESGVSDDDVESESASENEAEGNGDKGGRNDKPLPPNPREETPLLNALKKVWMEQDEDAEVLEDLARQGNHQSVSAFVEHIATVDEVAIVLAMTDAAFVVPIHSVFQFSAPPRAKDPNNGAYFGATGDRVEGEDPQFVKLQEGQFEWMKVKVLSDVGEGSGFDDWFAEPENRLAPFDSVGEAKEADQLIPKMPLVPAEIGHWCAEEPRTPYEVLHKLHTYANDRDEKVQTAMENVMTWCVMAATKRSNSRWGCMQRTLGGVSLPSKKLRAAMKRRIVETLGEGPEAQPQGPPPNFSAPDPNVAALAVLQQMASARPSVSEIANTYQAGVHDAMRLHHENESDTIYKRFTKVQRGGIMGWCGVRRWKDVKPIWKEIEQTKSEDDLRVVLNRAWQKKIKKLGLHATVYAMDWPDDMLSAIRQARPYESSEADFLTSELGLSPMALLPRSRNEQIKIREDKRAKKKANRGMNMTEARAEAKRANKTPRLPPTDWEGLATLLSSYSIVLDILFYGDNAHRVGVDKIRGSMMALSKVKDLLDPLYLANVLWAIIEDGSQHFHESIALDDFNDPYADIIWPQTDLVRLSHRMMDKEPLRRFTLPFEWEMACEEEPTPDDRQRGGGGGGGKGGGGKGGGGGKVGGGRAGGGGGGGRLGGRGDRDYEKGPPADGEEKWKDRYPERYGRGNKNPNVAKPLADLLAPLKKQGPLNLHSVIKSTGVSVTQLARMGRSGGEYTGKEPVCPYFACGSCPYAGCFNAHKWGKELPRGYSGYLCKQITPGVKTLLDAAGENPVKREDSKRKRGKDQGNASDGESVRSE